MNWNAAQIFPNCVTYHVINELKLLSIGMGFATWKKKKSLQFMQKLYMPERWKRICVVHFIYIYQLVSGNTFNIWAKNWV